MEVAHGVMGGSVPMAILPGGTANLMAVELGIPRNLEDAARIGCAPDSSVRNVDMGEAGNRRFMLQVGMGFAGEKVRLADRELKDRYGIMAYTIAGLKALKNAQVVSYHVEIDGKS
jgi:diacylglycerol kinase family enzyme